ncbi:hypothetical protein ACEPAF_9997 [Sanghuangporus sanghuang]
MADTTAQLPALDNTMGVLLIGVSLWGAGTVQVYAYYNNYPKDALWMKSLVGIVWVLDTSHQGLIIHTVYTYLITEYGNLVFLGNIVNSLAIEVIVNGIVAALVQAFFVLRAWRLSQGNIPVVVILNALIITTFALSIVYTIRALQLKTFARLEDIFTLSRVINVLNAVTDLAIAAVLIFLLHRSRTGFKRSDHIINRLILFSLNTGLLTSLDATMSLIANIVWSNTFIYILFFVNVSRLYTNSLMATLNSRKGLRGVDSSTGEESLSVTLSQPRFRSRAVELDAPSALKAAGQPRMLSINVNTETHTVREQEEGDRKGVQTLEFIHSMDLQDLASHVYANFYIQYIHSYSFDLRIIMYRLAPEAR